MKLVRVVLAFVCLLTGGVSVLNAQTVTVTASHLQDASGNSLTGTIYFKPGVPFKLNGVGNIISSQVSAVVTAGAFSLTLADTTQTSPVNACYVAWAEDSNGNVVLGSEYAGTTAVKQGYGCVQVSSTWCAGSACNFDNFSPTGSPLAIIQTGPTGPAGPSYTLPIASPSLLGGIKPDGSTLTINSTTGVASAPGVGGIFAGTSISATNALCTGATEDARISSCIAALTNGTGVVDTSLLTGAQTWAACPTWGTGQLTLILGPNLVTVNANCTIPYNVSLWFGPNAQISPSTLFSTTGTTVALESSTITVASAGAAAPGDSIEVAGGNGSANLFTTTITSISGNVLMVSPVIPSLVTAAAVTVNNTLTINGAINAPKTSTLFPTTIGTVFINYQTVEAGWFGVDPTRTVSSVTALVNAGTSLLGGGLGGKLHLSSGQFLIDRTLFFNQLVWVEGEIASGTTFYCTVTTTCVAMAFDFVAPTSSPGNPPYGGFKSISFRGPSALFSSLNYGVFLGGDPNDVVSPHRWYASNVRIEDTTFNNFSQPDGIGNNTYITLFRHVASRYNYAGLYFPNQPSNSGEMMVVSEASDISRNTCGYQSLGTTYTELRVADTSFDFNTQNAFCLGTGPIDLYAQGLHIEQEANNLINTQGPLRFTCDSCTFLADATSGTDTSMISIGSPTLGSYLNFIGGYAYASHPYSQFLLTGDTGNSRITRSGFQLASGSQIGSNPALPSAFTNDVNDVVTNLGLSLTGSALQLLPLTAPACVAATAGQLNYIQGNSTTKDTVQVCAHDATNAYAWRTIY